MQRFHDDETVRQARIAIDRQRDALAKLGEDLVEMQRESATINRASIDAEAAAQIGDTTEKEAAEAVRRAKAAQADTLAKEREIAVAERVLAKLENRLLEAEGAARRSVQAELDPKVIEARKAFADALTAAEDALGTAAALEAAYQPNQIQPPPGPQIPPGARLYIGTGGGQVLQLPETYIEQLEKATGP